ncbi:uncharacterized protein LOC118436074 isoform X2 [Folsomia candida]|uniref:uncharacterized protein LOC118436074 isoform X2 n=1 Tax=Folsomia candida TaxID=158441 RepID=UPI00160502CB|nr:uncharacterized protein LOC118436074 isoform X2 [Folsomia candida]XP_035709075.1 uncharacterized protein LOC118436074 isoform X2 [Folsomia candida]
MASSKEENSEIIGNSQKRKIGEEDSPEKKKPKNEKIGLRSLSQTVHQNSENISKLVEFFENMIGQSQAQPRQNNTCHVVDVGNEDDPITDLFTSIVDKSPNDESADQNIEIENPIVEEILNSNQSEDEYGPPLGLKVAAAFKRLIAQPASKEHIDQNKIKLKIPENIKEMRAPKVNCEIWTQLPKKAQVIDASQQFVQQFVSRGLVAQSHLAEVLAKNSDKIPNDLLKSLLSCSMEAATEFDMAFREISLRRRQQIKPFLSIESAGICGSSVPVTENLFGNNLEKDLIAVRTSAKIVKNLTPIYRGGARGTYARGSCNRGSLSNAGTSHNLNFRAPLLSRGGRRPFNRGRYNNYRPQN